MIMNFKNSIWNTQKIQENEHENITIIIPFEDENRIKWPR